jgi:hypothetical protein
MRTVVWFRGPKPIGLDHAFARARFLQVANSALRR